MTEQQIKELRSMLLDNKEPSNSEELDQTILTAARAQAQQLKSEPRTWLNSAWLNLVPFGAAGAAALSVCLTMGLLFGLSKMISVDESFAPKPAEANYVVKVVNGSKETEEVAAQIVNNLARPEDSFTPSSLSSQAKDQLLAEIDLPSTENLLGLMNFSLEADRSKAQGAIDVAMADIRFMLHKGRLDQARERYAKLVNSCAVCSLPETLDALVSTPNLNSGSG